MYKVLSQNEVLENLNQQNNIVSFQNDFANIKYKHFQGSCGASMITLQSSFNEDVSFCENLGQANQDIAYISFILGENINFRESINKNNLTVKKASCYNGTFVDNYKSTTLYSKNKNYTSINIMLKPSLYKELFTNKSIHCVFKSDKFTLNFHNHITANQQILLSQILNQPFDSNDILSQIFLESKLLELIHTTAKLNQENYENKPPLSNDDIKCIHKAKEILLNDITNPPSLEELARLSATNTFKLKQGFKQVFGNTVYGLLREYRLNKAKTLLKSGDININEATKIVGYKNASNFSRAFKEHFGINAIEVKKKNIF